MFRRIFRSGAVRRFVPQWLEFGLIAVAAITLLAFGFSILWATIAPIPSIDNFQNREVAQSTKIYDRTGNIVLYDVHGSMRRVAVPLDHISPYIQHARKNGIPIEMDESLFAKLAPGVKIIGVTGTRGKSTTTILI